MQKAIPCTLYLTRAEALPVLASSVLTVSNMAKPIFLSVQFSSSPKPK
jgi:hypothetical protein